MLLKKLQKLSFHFLLFLSIKDPRDGVGHCHLPFCGLAFPVESLALGAPGVPGILDNLGVKRHLMVTFVAEFMTTT